MMFTKLFSAKFVIAAAAFLLLFGGCGSYPPAFREANSLALRAATAALADNAKTNEGIVEAFRQLLQADLDRAKADVMRKIIQQKDGKNYIEVEDLAKYNALVSEKQTAVDAQIAKIKQRLADNQINGEVAAAILKRLISAEKEYDAKRSTLAGGAKSVFDDVLNLYDQIKAKTPTVEGK